MERKVTILDEYDCTIMSDRIRIVIDSPRDPSLADILSELHDSDGYFHFDGLYYVFNGDYTVGSDDTVWYLDLQID